MSTTYRNSLMIFWSRILIAVTMLNSCGSDVKQTPNPKTPAVPTPDMRKKIIFFGDSITEQGAQPGGFIDLLNTYLKNKHLDSTYVLIGKGVSGNKVTDLWNRVDEDVIAGNPSVVIVYIGINDVWHSLQGSGTSPEQYKAILTKLINKIKATNAQVVLCTPSVIGEKKNVENQFDSMLDQYADSSRVICNETQVQLCDLRKVFVDSILEENTDNVSSGLFTDDGVHLNSKGNQLVANSIAPFIHK